MSWFFNSVAEVMISCFRARENGGILIGNLLFQRLVLGLRISINHI